MLAHRVAWSAVLTALLVIFSGKTGQLAEVLTDRRRLAGLAGSATCISLNWVAFIWAVGNGHALDASLGYFLYPLCAVVLGAALLGERLTGRQKAAVALVCVGVGVLAAGLGRVPWLVLAFPSTFGLYALLRKVVAVDALVGLAVETLLLFPLAILFLVSRPDGGALLAGGPSTSLLLVASGPVTAIPLILFAYGARRLRLSTLGLIQYINPTIQMAIAVLAFGEAFNSTHAVTFACIWAGLVLYSVPRRQAAESS